MTSLYRYRYIKKKFVYVTLFICYLIPVMYGLAPLYYYGQDRKNGDRVR